MDATQTYFALREAGIELRLSEDRLLLHADPAERLTTHMSAALADNHAMLVKQELLKEVLRFVAERLRKRDGNPEGDYTPSPATRVAFEIMAANQEFIADAMDEYSLDGFKQTLRDYTRSALEAYDNARQRLQRQTVAVEQPAAGDMAAERYPGPLQESLL